MRYCGDGDLAIDNNATERSLRGFAVGRNNWTFFGSDTGGKTAAVLRSFVTSCELVKIDPFAWFKDVLGRIRRPSHEAAGRTAATSLGRDSPFLIRLSLQNWLHVRRTLSPIPVLGRPGLIRQRGSSDAYTQAARSTTIFHSPDSLPTLPTLAPTIAAGRGRGQWPPDSIKNHRCSE
jgi:hypothetical protein